MKFPDLKEFTAKQLAFYNGSEKEQIYVAYRGFIYDVSESRLFRNGKHYEHWAGQDLTAELKMAPHNDRVFKRFNIVGKLISG